MMIVLMYVSSPVVFGLMLMKYIKSGAVLPEADAPTIPFMGFMMLWMFALPFVIVLCGVIEKPGRKYYAEDN